ncbi:MAG: hypothetical protein DHS20C14_19750 [Phycisphaeraceae bacterium]|nr:MAG: hypothetical protein DHS20C14_19750 [Phycisphaeraceae bacterium]
MFAECLEAARCECGFKVLAWVAMPEHVHLLIVPDLPNHPVPQLLRRIKEPTARRMLSLWRERDDPVLAELIDIRGRSHFWQRGGGYDRNIFAGPELVEKARYIEENPVRRGLVDVPTAWAWSSARCREDEGAGIVSVDPMEC